MVSLSQEIWGKIGDEKITRYTLSGKDLSVSVINFGATVQRIVYRGMDMIISLPEAELYSRYSMACIGAVVGRYAGRVSGGKFCIDGRDYQLSRNRDGNHLHGGFNGLGSRIWTGESTENGVRFSLLSPDGEEGYPGNLNVSVTYSIIDGSSLSIEYEAFCDMDTILNLTSHCYFGPNGVDPAPPSQNNPPENRDVELMIRADRILALRDELPTGRLIPVDGTRFDFRSPERLSVRCGNQGFDNTFVLSPHSPEQPVASARGLKSGVRIDCFTDQPGAQLFVLGASGDVFALETQHFPDSPNHPEFPDTILRAGDTFRSGTVYRFSHE